MDTAVSVELFVEILNRYVYYFDQQNETVSLNLTQMSLRLGKHELTMCEKGNNQISQRTDRADSLEPVNHQCRGKCPELGESETPFLQNIGVYQVKRLRRCGHGREAVTAEGKGGIVQ